MDGRHNTGDIFPITIEFLRGAADDQEIISHGTVPKIFHFINRAGGGGNNVVGETWQFAYAFIKIIRRGNTLSVPSREDRTAVNLCAPRSSTAIQTTPPVIPFVSPCFAAPGIDPVNSSPILIPLSRGATEYLPRFPLFYESRSSCKHID